MDSVETHGPHVPSEPLSGGVEDVHDWFTYDDGKCSIVSAEGRTKTSLDSYVPPDQNDHLPLARSLSRLSLRKVDTRSTMHTIVPIYGVLDLSLLEVCKYVDDETTLQTAIIVSSECYAIRSGAVIHRFVVLELHRPGRKDIWLRLDRRREDVSARKLLAAFGTTRANDKAMLSSIKARLVGGATRENRKFFTAPPNLKELCCLLRVVIDELTSYRIWPDNCWFFCSLVQQHLGGVFVNGGPTYAPQAREIRAQIFHRVWPDTRWLATPVPNMPGSGIPGTIVFQDGSVSSNGPPPNPPTTSLSESEHTWDTSQLNNLDNIIDEGLRSLPSLLALADTSILIDKAPPSNTETNLSKPSGSGILRDDSHDQFYEGPSRSLVSKMFELSTQTYINPCVRQRIKKALALAPGIVLMKSISRGERKRATEFRRLLDKIGRLLRSEMDFSDVEQAIPFFVEAIRLQHALLKDTPPSHHGELSRMKERLLFSLHEQQRVKMAFRAAETSLEIQRKSYHVDPDTEREALATLLNKHSQLLHENDRYRDALASCKEAVELWESLYKIDEETHIVSYAKSLAALAKRFHSVQHFDDAKVAHGQAVQLARMLYKKDPERHRRRLVRWLHNYITSLGNLGLPNEARAAFDEYTSLMQASDLDVAPHTLGPANKSHPAYEHYLRTSSTYGASRSIYEFDEPGDREHMDIAQDPGLLSSGRHETSIISTIDIHSIQKLSPFTPYQGPSPKMISLLRELSSDTTLVADVAKLNVVQALEIAIAIPLGPLDGKKLESLVRFRDIVNNNITPHHIKFPDRIHQTILVCSEMTRLERTLCIGTPLGRQVNLATLLRNEALALVCDGRADDALELHEEGLAIRRECYRLAPGAERSNLADHLFSYAYCLYLVKRYDEAVKMGEEALKLRRLLYEFDMNEGIGPLAILLHNLGAWLYSAKRLEDARIVDEEVLVLLRILYETDPKLYGKRLADCLENYCVILKALSLKKEAEAARSEYHELRALFPKTRREVLKLAGYADGSVRLWSAESSTVIVAFNGNKKAVTALAFDDTGARRASGSQDTEFIPLQAISSPPQNHALLELWDLSIRHRVQTVVAHQSEIWSTATDPIGKDLIFAGSGDGELKAWRIDDEALGKGVHETETGDYLAKMIHPLTSLPLSAPSRVSQIAFHPTESYLAVQSHDRSVELFHVRTEEEVRKKQARRKKTEKEKKDKKGKSKEADAEVEPEGKGEVEKDVILEDLFTPYLVFWELEKKVVEGKQQPALVHVKTLKMSDDVLAVKYSPDGRLLAVPRLDLTVKVFYADSLKFFLSLYGHKLPVLALDISTDSRLIATVSADKNIKIWGLDFGDCHQSIFAHDESIMQVAFEREIDRMKAPGEKGAHSHYIWTVGKDKMLKYWDGGKFENIQKLNGHHGEVWALAISNNGKSVITGSHDKSLRVWEKTDEPVKEEREKELEALYESRVADSLNRTDAAIGSGVEGAEEQALIESGAVTKQTADTLMAGERIVEALDLADRERALFRAYEEECAESQDPAGIPLPARNPLLALNLTPEEHVLRTVEKVRAAELFDALLVLPFSKVLSMIGYLNECALRSITLVSRIVFFLLKTHHHQIVATRSVRPVLVQLRTRLRNALRRHKDEIGYNVTGLRYIRRTQEARSTADFYAEAQLDETVVMEKLAGLEKKRKRGSLRG
ncbi:hypothetical protein DL93DRAFT_2171326 [Clavulina sp. PMI_390]|nr:hypothetical protein DL93DRAFT_2171326 [Clavulina sp. PMI_390]